MTTNPLISARGFQWVRCNGGSPVPLRATLHLIGADATDDAARNRTLCDVTNQVYIALTADLPPLDDAVYRESVSDWFGVDPAFQAASDCYINTTGPDITVAWLAPPTGSGTTRKRVINVSATYSLNMTNTVGATTPGYLMGRARNLAPGEACRATWDPTGQRWLINDGQASANYVTQQALVVTQGGETITVTL